MVISDNMKIKTEYQVVHGNGDVEGSLTLKEARNSFDTNKQATELRKVIWKIDDADTWESAGEGEREDITIREREST